MKKIKKLRPGMTLVEVVIAMAIFSAMTLGICMTFAACFKYNARNVERDIELNNQQTALEQFEGGTLALRDGSSFDNNQLVFQPAGSTTEYDIKVWNEATNSHTTIGSNLTIGNVSEYQAIPTKLNTELDNINFNLKKFSGSLLGANTVTFKKSNGEYRIRIINQSGEAVDATIENLGGSLFLGNSTDGKISTVTKTVKLPGENEKLEASEEAERLEAANADVDSYDIAPCGFEIGYALPDGTFNVDDSTGISTLKAGNESMDTFQIQLFDEYGGTISGVGGDTIVPNLTQLCNNTTAKGIMVIVIDDSLNYDITYE